MTDSGGATLFEDLPEEIIDKILIRLSSKDVGRCRVVSTSLYGATSTPKFMIEHHRRQPSLPIINGNKGRTDLAVFGAGASSQYLWPFLQGKNSPRNDLCASCDGFIIVSQRSRLYICNPVIRKHALLLVAPTDIQDMYYCSVIGFYQHRLSGEYKVLWVSHPQPWPEFKSSLYVLTVGSDEPRKIRVRTATVLSPSVEQQLLGILCHKIYSAPPVNHRASLQWCPDGANHITGGGGDVIVFDTEAESFRWMRSPMQLCFYRKLFDMKGELAFWGRSTPGFTAINVWVMQDYEAEIWDFKYHIDLSTVEASRQLHLTSLRNKKKKKRKNKNKTPVDSTVELFNDMAVLNERELLIRFNEKYVLRCDIDGKFLGIVRIEKSRYCIKLTQHRLQESIIPIPYHGIQEEDEVHL